MNRYGDDPELEALRRRSRWRAAASLVVAGLFGLPLLAQGVLFVGMVVCVLVLVWSASPVSAVVLVAVVGGVLWLATRAYRDAGRSVDWTMFGVDVPKIEPVGDDHAAHQMLVRLCARAGVAVPGLELVEARGMNACVVERDGRRAIRVTRAAFSGLTGEQLEAVLAHELFHVEHGDAISAARMEDAVNVADTKGGSFERFIRRGLCALLRGRELAADRAAVLLTGRPGALAEAIELCSRTRTDIPDGDLRAWAVAAFVAEEYSGSGSLATHPTTHERLEVIARAGAQLGQP